MNILTVIGARPQFIKTGPVSKELRKSNEEIILHTGQHYDDNMSESFFNELKIPEPDYNLFIGSGCHGLQTGKMLIGIEEVLMKEKNDLVLIYGDTNSTIAGSIAAIKLQIPVAHVESGLRSFNKKMPEEINRIVTDHLSAILYTPTNTAVSNLLNEGINKERIIRTGDVMYDAFLYAKKKLDIVKVLSKYDLKENEYVLSTIHRPENTDTKKGLLSLLKGLNGSPKKVIIPLHPRTRDYITKHNLKDEILKLENVSLIDPVGYLEFISLELGAWKIATDSGGIQKEAYLAGKPCITMRKQTEWVETVETGWNILVTNDTNKIKDALENFNPKGYRPQFYGDGKAAKQIANHINSLEPGKILL